MRFYISNILSCKAKRQHLLFYLALQGSILLPKFTGDTDLLAKNFCANLLYNVIFSTDVPLAMTQLERFIMSPRTRKRFNCFCFNLWNPL